MAEWKEIAGYEHYLVNTIGRVLNTDSGRTLKHHYDRAGYKFVRVSNNGIVKKFKTHRLVALTFIPNPENKPQVNHKNGIRDDNRVENLEWCTGKENIHHSLHIIKTYPVGSKKYNSKLRESDIVEIRKLAKEGVRQNKIAEKYGVHPGTIYQVISRNRWKHVA